MIQTIASHNPKAVEGIELIKEEDKEFYHFIGSNIEFDQERGVAKRADLKKFCLSPNVWNTTQAVLKTAKGRGFQQMAIIHDPNLPMTEEQVQKDDIRNLTEQQQERALELFEEGASAKEIAADLGRGVRIKDVEAWTQALEV